LLFGRRFVMQVFEQRQREKEDPADSGFSSTVFGVRRNVKRVNRRHTRERERESPKVIHRRNI
jgi:hypothetical protein